MWIHIKPDHLIHGNDIDDLSARFKADKLFWFHYYHANTIVDLFQLNILAANLRKFDDYVMKDQHIALLLLTSVPGLYEQFVTTLLYRKTSTTLYEVTKANDETWDEDHKYDWKTRIR